jgi:pyruvate formate lyase activating enzyme
VLVTMSADSDFGIKGFLETSFLDWPGRLAAVLFLGGCNFRCPFCHNAELVEGADALPSIPLDGVLGRLARLRGWVDAVVVSGGEPTCNPRLGELLGRIHSAGFEIKLDTNGSRPDVLARLLARRAVQAVDMDVKAPLEAAAYARLAGLPVRLAEIRASLDLLALSGLPHRFRTTFVPGLLDRAALARMRDELPAGSPFILQAFNPRRVLDPALAEVRAPAPEEILALQALCDRAAAALPAVC